MISTILFILSFLGLCSAQICNQDAWMNGMIGGGDSPWCFQAHEFPEYPAKNGQNGPCTSDVCKVYDEVESKEKCHDIILGSALCDDKWGFQYSENGGRCWPKGSDGTYSTAGENWWIGPIDRQSSCLDAATTTNQPTDEYKFQLRGSAGSEMITILDGPDIIDYTLSNTWTEFTAYTSEIRIQFHNDDGGNRNVFFQSELEHYITEDSYWAMWRCDTPDEIARCDMIRRGELDWNGSYDIHFIDGATTTNQPDETTVQCPGFGFVCDCADDCMAGAENADLCSCPEAQRCCESSGNECSAETVWHQLSTWYGQGQYGWEISTLEECKERCCADSECVAMTVSLSMTQDPEVVGECYLVSESSAESIANGVEPISDMPAYVQIDKDPEPTDIEGCVTYSADGATCDECAEGYTRGQWTMAGLCRKCTCASTDADGNEECRCATCTAQGYCQSCIDGYDFDGSPQPHLERCTPAADAIKKAVVKRLFKIVPRMIERTKGNIRRVVKRMKRDMEGRVANFRQDEIDIITDIDQNVDIDEAIPFGRTMENIDRLNAFYRENGETRDHTHASLDVGQVKNLLRVASTKHQVGYKEDLNRQMNKIIDIRDDEGLDYGLTYGEQDLELLTADRNIPAYQWLPFAYQQYFELKEKYRDDGTLRN